MLAPRIERKIRVTHGLSLPARRLWAALLILGAAGCAEAPDRDAVRGMAPGASLDARGMGRGGASERPASVQSQRAVDRGVTILTVSPRLQTGSQGSLPIIVTSLGAERQDATGKARTSLLVTVSNARGYGGFSRAESRGGGDIPVRVVGRSTDCAGISGCLYVETLLLAVPEEAVRQAAAGNGLRVRIDGNASFVETAVPAGHLRALADALGTARGG
ncbi:hypothetical protein [Roseomonas indoligenes]|uniref:Lipoprotein n=1 Tax=Roseomonas indoligenes TaxID=2820811 RepID=A0A940MWP8_9PROT|nr:hypothetical protein [Pararoseomonas indoligenes]MBP0491881.1 hypothetical protein [Pararoseomonas indoligenes]